MDLIRTPLYDCLAVLMACVFIIDVFKIQIFVINSQRAIAAVNISMLLLASLFGFFFLRELYTDCTSGPEFRQNLSERATGLYWYLYWLPILAYIVVPQLLWISRFRSNIRISMLMVMCCFLVKVFLRWRYTTFDYIPSSWVLYSFYIYLACGVIVITAVTTIYLLTKK